jgi:flagellar biosynthesis protein FlhG
MTRIVTVTSARGGVGTTSIALNLAAQLGQLGLRVCLLDGDVTAPSIATRLGLNPQHNLTDLFDSSLALDQVLVHECHGIDLLPGAADGGWIKTPDAEGAQRLASVIRELDAYDWIVVDSVAGVDGRGLCFALASPELIVTVTPEAERLSEAYALLKLLTCRHYTGSVSVVFNRSGPGEAVEGAFARLRDAAHQCLDMPLQLLGSVQDHAAVQHGVLDSLSLLSYTPDSPAAEDFAALTSGLLGAPAREAGTNAFAEAWLRCTAEPNAYPTEVVVAGRARAAAQRAELEQQIEALATQVDQMLAEMNRLREEGEDIARLVTSPGAAPRPNGPEDMERWIADRAGATRVVKDAELSFPVYDLPRKDDSTLKVACHTRDSEVETAAPRTTSS